MQFSQPLFNLNSIIEPVLIEPYRLDFIQPSFNNNPEFLKFLEFSLTKLSAEQDIHVNSAPSKPLLLRNTGIKLFDNNGKFNQTGQELIKTLMIENLDSKSYNKILTVPEIEKTAELLNSIITENSHDSEPIKVTGEDLKEIFQNGKGEIKLVFSDSVLSITLTKENSQTAPDDSEVLEKPNKNDQNNYDSRGVVNRIQVLAGVENPTSVNRVVLPLSDKAIGSDKVKAKIITDSNNGPANQVQITDVGLKTIIKAAKGKIEQLPVNSTNVTHNNSSSQFAHSKLEENGGTDPDKVQPKLETAPMSSDNEGQETIMSKTNGSIYSLHSQPAAVSIETNKSKPGNLEPVKADSSSSRLEVTAIDNTLFKGTSGKTETGEIIHSQNSINIEYKKSKPKLYESVSFQIKGQHSEVLESKNGSIIDGEEKVIEKSTVEEAAPNENNEDTKLNLSVSSQENVFINDEKGGNHPGIENNRKGRKAHLDVINNDLVPATKFKISESVKEKEINPGKIKIIVDSGAKIVPYGSEDAQEQKEKIYIQTGSSNHNTNITTEFIENHQNVPSAFKMEGTESSERTDGFYYAKDSMYMQDSLDNVKSTQKIDFNEEKISVLSENDLFVSGSTIKLEEKVTAKPINTVYEFNNTIVLGSKYKLKYINTEADSKNILVETNVDLSKAPNNEVLTDNNIIKKSATGNVKEHALPLQDIAEYKYENKDKLRIEVVDTVKSERMMDSSNRQNTLSGNSSNVTYVPSTQDLKQETSNHSAINEPEPLNSSVEKASHIKINSVVLDENDKYQINRPDNSHSEKIKQVIDTKYNDINRIQHTVKENPLTKNSESNSTDPSRPKEGRIDQNSSNESREEIKNEKSLSEVGPNYVKNRRDNGSVFNRQNAAEQKSSIVDAVKGSQVLDGLKNVQNENAADVMSIKQTIQNITGDYVDRFKTGNEVNSKFAGDYIADLTKNSKSKEISSEENANAELHTLKNTGYKDFSKFEITAEEGKYKVKLELVKEDDSPNNDWKFMNGHDLFASKENTGSSKKNEDGSVVKEDGKIEAAEKVYRKQENTPKEEYFNGSQMRTQVNNNSEKTETITRTIFNISPDEIVKEVKSIISSGESSQAIIRINPEHLGEIKLIIEVEKNIVKASIDVENESVKQIIQSNIEVLRTQISQQGMQLQGININLNGGEQNLFKQKNNKTEDGINPEEGKKILQKDKKKLNKKLGYNTYEFTA